MKVTKVGKRYGKALLDFAVEQAKLEEVYGDVNDLLNACLESRELQVLLKSPIIKDEKKANILAQITEGKISTITTKFISLLIKRGRAPKLIDILVGFNELYLTYKNILRTEIISVNGVSEAIKLQLTQVVQNAYKKEVLIEEKLDTSLIGGLIINVGDKQINASVKAKLDELKRGYDYNPFESSL